MAGVVWTPVAESDLDDIQMTLAPKPHKKEMVIERTPEGTTTREEDAE